MAVPIIRIGGADITSDVIFKSATFTSAARGRAGTAQFKIRNVELMHTFSTGDSLTLDVDGVRVWGGFVQKITRGYFFEADCKCRIPMTPAYLILDGVDYNVLLQRRVIYDKVTPTNAKLTAFPPGTSDQEVLLAYLADHADILADGVTTSLIESVGVPYSDIDIMGSAGWNIDDLMRYLTQNTGAIYYIDPDKAFVLTDVDTPSAAFGISDTPIAGEVGCRELEIDFDGANLRNDALVWGAGQGSPVPVFSRTTDSASVTEHQLWQVGEFNPTVWHQATVDRMADTYVYGTAQNQRGGKDDKVSIKCTVYTPGFRVAQKVAFRSEVFDFTDVIPIRSIHISFPTTDTPRFDLILGHDIDDPWSTFEFWFPEIPTIPPLPVIHTPVIHLPPNDPCASGDCRETFSRTVTDGLGTSEIGGEDWTVTQGNAARFSVIDGEAKLNVPVSGISAGTIRLADLYFQEPTEILLTMRMAREGPRTTEKATFGTGLDYFSRFNMYLSPMSSGFTAPLNSEHQGFSLEWRPNQSDAPANLALPDEMLVAVKGNPSRTVFTPDILEQVYLEDGDPAFQSTFYVRWRLDADGMHLRVWSQDQPEPSEWLMESAYPYSPSPVRHYWWMNYSGGYAHNLYISSINVTRGLYCQGDTSLISPPAYSTYCFDSFNRMSQSVGWGTGEWGIPWESVLVTGNGAGDPAQAFGLMWTNGTQGMFADPGYPGDETLANRPIDAFVYPRLTASWSLPAEVTITGTWYDWGDLHSRYTSPLGINWPVSIFYDSGFDWRMEWRLPPCRVVFYASGGNPAEGFTTWQAWLDTDTSQQVIFNYAPDADSGRGYTPNAPPTPGATYHLLSTWTVENSVFFPFEEQVTPGYWGWAFQNFLPSPDMNWGCAIRVTEDIMAARAWGPSGPGDWVTINEDGVVPTTMEARFGSSTWSMVGVDHIHTTGMNCSPCGLEAVSDPDCGSLFSEALISLDQVVGQVYGTTYAWEPGTEQVYIDGLRLPNSAYTAYPDDMRIVLDSPINNASLATVTIYYTVAC